jgi:hypothetical protein
LLGCVILAGDAPDFQMAVSRFGPQTRSGHTAVGEFKRGGDRKPQQRLIANTAGIGELGH